MPNLSQVTHNKVSSAKINRGRGGGNGLFCSRLLHACRRIVGVVIFMKFYDDFCRMSEKMTSKRQTCRKIIENGPDVPCMGDRLFSSAGTERNCDLPMRLPNPSPVLDSTGAGFWRKAPSAFPDSSSALDKFREARGVG